MIRALLRVVLLTGLVVCGWLLGSGTGLAHEEPADPAGLAGLSSLAPLADGNRVDPLPLANPIPLVQPSVEEQLAASAGNLAPVAPAPVGEALTAQPPAPVATVLAPVLSGQQPALIDQRGAPRVAVLTERPAPARATPEVTPPAVRAPPTPLHWFDAPRAVPLLPGGSTADALAIGSTERSGDRGGLAPEVPAGPVGTVPTACLVSLFTANPGAPSGQAVTLIDSRAATDLALVQRRLNPEASGVPQGASQQPSTSPD